MTTPDPNDAPTKPSTKAKAVTTDAAAETLSPDISEIAAKAKEHNIRVSPAVLDAAGKDGDALLQSLHTNLRHIW